MQINSERIEIVAACDDKYVQHLGVMLCSLLENISNRENIKLNVIDGGISLENKKRIDDFLKNKYQASINYLEIDTQIYSKFKISHHITHATYYRISIPSLFPNHINKVLYLDCDLIVKEDISRLWDFDIKNYSIAAVRTLLVDRIHLQGIMPKESLYFNAGILLINLYKWRVNDTSTKLIQFLQDNPHRTVFWDQDSLNAILYDDYLLLPLRWNLQSNFFEIRDQNRSQELQEAITNPAIIHYTGMHKPWDYIDNHPYKQEYYKYLALTPWHNYQPKKTFKLFIERIVRIYTPSFLLRLLKYLYHQYFKHFKK